jgi:hypothetical protein
MRKNIQVNIAGYKATLYERTSFDVRELEDFTIKHREKIDNKFGLLIACAKIADALAPAKLSDIKFYQVIKRFRLRKMRNTTWLMKHLSDNEIVDLVEKINTLEEAEKKKTAENL